MSDNDLNNHIEKSLECIVILTSRGKAQILREGGSQEWRLNANRARNLPYAVCVQNTHQYREGQTKHHHAFLVGKISGISKTDENRWKVEFDEYADIDIPNQWDGNRNPIAYRNLKSMGIDVNLLEFKPMPEVDPSELKKQIPKDIGNKREEGIIQPLSIQEAKKGLAIKFGVNEDDIQISIKG